MRRRERLERIVELLMQGPRTTAELAECLEVSQRTIQRDVLDLQGEPRYVPLLCDRQFLWALVSRSAYGGDRRHVGRSAEEPTS